MRGSGRIFSLGSAGGHRQHHHHRQSSSLSKNYHHCCCHHCTFHCGFVYVAQFLESLVYCFRCTEHAIVNAASTGDVCLSHGVNGESGARSPSTDGDLFSSKAISHYSATQCRITQWLSHVGREFPEERFWVCLGFRLLHSEVRTTKSL